VWGRTESEGTCATHTHLGLFPDAVADYERARNVIVENNETDFEAFGDGSPARSVAFKRLPVTLPGVTADTIADDAEKLRNLAAADVLKKDGDAYFADGRLEEAAGKYTAALDLAPMHVGCLSNRSACKLALRDVQGCVEDCTRALSFLAIDVSAAADKAGIATATDTSMLRSILPPPGSDKRKSWVLKTTLRRGAAHAQLSRLDEAVEDFRLAAALDPNNEAIKSDLTKMMNFRQGKNTSVPMPTGERKPRPDEPLKEEDGVV
jgi:tetratricopeptide (TPR) repeat protein